MSFKIKFSDGRTISVSEIELHSLLAVGVVDSDTHIYKGETEEPVSLDTESMGTKVRAPELRPIARRHDWLKGALIAFIITCGMMALSNLHAAQVIGNLVNNPDYYQYPEEVGAFSDLHQGITALLYIVAYLFCIVLFCLFFYRAMRNLQQVGASDAEMQPGWVVGWNFIPIANLFMPFSGVKQIYKSSSRLAGNNVAAPAILYGWWIGWIIAAIASRVTSRMSANSVGKEPSGEIINYDLYISSLHAEVGINILLIGTSIALLHIIKRVDDAQLTFMPQK